MSAKPPIRLLKNCEVILNYACNARCLFCYHPAVLREGELPFRDVARALMAGRERGCSIAHLIGGEITLRDDLPRIVALARKLGYPCVQILSNGLRLSDRDFSRRVVEAGANLIRISVHGRDAATHDRLVGVPGAFEKCLRALEHASGLGAEIGVNHALTALNLEALPGFVELMLDRFGLRDLNVIFPHYRGELPANFDLLRLTLSQAAPRVREAMELLARRAARVEGRVLVNFTPCVLPGFEHLMAEWERPGRNEDDDWLTHVEGGRDRVHAQKERQCLKPDSCAGCVYDARCLGVERDYAARFGVAEFRAVPAAPEPFPLFPTFERAARWGIGG
jgi:MoaA/NifB/PqqE/SkfB family radical SAM enzyme